MTVKIIIGYTLSDREGGYHPTLSGYRPGAAQHEVHLDVGGCGRHTHRRMLALVASRTRPLDWAEALFVATNVPLEVLDEDPRPVVWLLRAAIVEQPTVRAVMRPLSVGDTVTIGGVTLACARVGWIAVPAPHGARPGGSPA